MFDVHFRNLMLPVESNLWLTASNGQTFVSLDAYLLGGGILISLSHAIYFLQTRFANDT